MIDRRQNLLRYNQRIMTQCSKRLPDCSADACDEKHHLIIQSRQRAKAATSITCVKMLILLRNEQNTIQYTVR